MECTYRQIAQGSCQVFGIFKTPMIQHGQELQLHSVNESITCISMVLINIQGFK